MSRAAWKHGRPIRQSDRAKAIRDQTDQIEGADRKFRAQPPPAPWAHQDARTQPLPPHRRRETELYFQSSLEGPGCIEPASTHSLWPRSAICTARSAHSTTDAPPGVPRPPARALASAVEVGVVGVVGLEPTTLNPQSSGSTTELHPAGRETTTRRSTEAAVFAPSTIVGLGGQVHVSAAGWPARRAGNPAKCYPLPSPGAAGRPAPRCPADPRGPHRDARE